MEGTHPPPPGWYPDPPGQQRYWDGQAWHHAVTANPDLNTNRRRFVKFAIASAVTCVVSFVLMQLTFHIGGWLQFLGLVLFPVFLVSAVATVVCIVGTIVGRLK